MTKDLEIFNLIEDERQRHDPTISAKGESAGPIESGIIDRMPSQLQKKIIFEDRQRDKDESKKRGTEDARARCEFDHFAR